MTRMIRWADRYLVLAMLSLAVVAASAQQPTSVLHIKVVLTDAEQQPMPVPRHRLLISDNPTTSPPREVVTAPDGTANVRLRPGNYTVESDQPVAFQGKAYQWTQMLDIVEGRDTLLELTTANAEVVPLASATITAPPAPGADLSAAARWQDGVVAIWSPTAHASGFVIDANGLIATNQRSIGTAKSAEVQLTPTVKVAARVLAADPVRDVALLWIDPTLVASLPIVPLGCAGPARPPVKYGQKIFTIGAPLHQEKGAAFGSVTGVTAHGVVSDLGVSSGGAGGPVFTADGDLIGLTSADSSVGRQREDTRVVRVEEVCEVVASARHTMNGAVPPSGTPLPVEPPVPFPVGALEEAARRRAGSLNPYQMSSADFDIAFMTPVQIYGAEPVAVQSSERDRGRGPRPPQVGQAFRPLMDFGTWSEYVRALPPVLLVRVTPKLVEGFWTKVGRGAAQTQGMVLPPLKHPKASFSRLRAFCGDAEITPIHPFELEHRLSDTDAINEGLYVFDPGALAPSCQTVRLLLYSEKEPEKGDARVVDPKIVQQIWQDFAPYRAVR